MGTCTICGTDVDGAVCDTHQEDVCFEFRGNHPNQLTPGRFYRGTVDGYADFGVFVDLSGGVTGLLHRSEVDVRLDSLDWEPGDSVYVQVTDVRDNGNVDLGWSIRQSKDEFRGALIDDPSAEGNAVQPDEEAAQGNEDAPASSGAGASDGGTTAPTDREPSDSGPAESADADAVAESTDSADPDEPPERVATDDLDDHVGDRVLVEATIDGVRQTSGPTLFSLRDETGAVECAAFESAGVRAYPDAEEGDAVRLIGEVERRHGALQVETEELTVLSEADGAEIRDRLDAALTERAAVEGRPLLAGHDPVSSVGDAIQEAATEIRKAVLSGRPIVVRHAATADGHVAGAAIERATLPLIEAEHPEAEAGYHYFDRRPIDDPAYDLDPAIRDATSMLDDAERHDESLPLFVLLGVGGTDASLPGLKLLNVYGVDRVVVDTGRIDDSIDEAVTTVVAPDTDGSAAGVTETALAANIAVHVAEVRDSIAHLPAISYWESPPEEYVALADDAGYDADACRELREAIELSAYYQTHEDKRQLISDLLFGEGTGRELAAHVSEQFREKLENELATVEANLDLVDRDGTGIAVLDADAYTHRFDFPPRPLLLDALHRRLRDDVAVTVAVDEASLDLRGTELDRRELAADAAERAPDAAIGPVGGGAGGLRFLRGERDDAVDAVLAALGERL